MKRLAFAIAALAGLASASTPAFATTSLADLRGRGEGIERLLEQMHKKLKVVVKNPHDGRGGGGADTTTSTSTSTGTSTAGGRSKFFPELK
jgi:hypothetical protein